MGGPLSYNRIGEIENGRNGWTLVPHSRDNNNAFRFTPPITAIHHLFTGWMRVRLMHTANIEDFNVKAASSLRKGNEFHQRLIPQNWMELSQKVR